MPTPVLSLSAYVPSAARISPACRGCSGAIPLTSSNSSGAACPSGLKEEERRKLARYFSISEALARGAARRCRRCRAACSASSAIRSTVSAGPGAIVTEELGKPYFAFDERWLKALTASSPANLSIVRVEGDSMAPTLNAGDDILVDLGDAGQRLRDGIYVLRIDDALVVKRVALNPLGRRITIQSDNPAYPDWPDCGLDEINCIGRVIWSGRRDRLAGSPAVDQPQDQSRGARRSPVPSRTPFIGLPMARPADESGENATG